MHVKYKKNALEEGWSKYTGQKRGVFYDSAQSHRQIEKKKKTHLLSATEIFVKRSNIFVFLKGYCTVFSLFPEIFLTERSL